MTEKQWLTHCLGNVYWFASWHICTLCCGLSKTDSRLVVRSVGCREKGRTQSYCGVKLRESGEMQYLMPVTLGVDFTVMGKYDVLVFLPTEQLVTIGDFCFAVLL